MPSEWVRLDLVVGPLHMFAPFNLLVRHEHMQGHEEQPICRMPCASILCPLQYKFPRVCAVQTHARIVAPCVQAKARWDHNKASRKISIQGCLCWC